MSDGRGASARHVVIAVLSNPPRSAQHGRMDHTQTTLSFIGQVVCRPLSLATSAAIVSSTGCGYISRQHGMNRFSDSTMIAHLFLLLGCVRASAIASRQGNLTCDAGATLCGDTCVDLNTDRFNCGECGGWCAVAGNQCRDGVCGCEDGTERCGPFCANLQTDDLHCGRCDRSVSPTSQTQLIPVWPELGGKAYEV